MTRNAPLSAKSIAAEISSKRLTASKAMALGDKNIADREADLHVFTERADNPKAGKGPLAGITVGVKDIFDTYDLPTRYGSKIYPEHQPATDAAVVSMLREAGATIIGKTVTTEFAWFSPGPTRNPHNLKHTPGGSSSGSAAGVAAGFFSAAVGSQTGGSVIRPAAFCGVAGYKPSFRLFPTVGMKQFSWSLDTTGFFAGSVADVAFVAAAASGRDLEVRERKKTPPVIGLYKGDFDTLMSEDMANALKHIARCAKAWGASVKTVKGPKAVEAARAAHAPIQGFEAVLSLADEAARNNKLLSKPLRDYLKECRSITPQEYDDARRTANRARKATQAIFDKCDVLLMPSAPGIAPKGLKSTGDSRFNQLWTLMGMPCVNVPGLFSKDGMPIGIQVVAPFGRDQEALQAAHWLETIIQADLSK